MDGWLLVVWGSTLFDLLLFGTALTRVRGSLPLRAGIIVLGGLVWLVKTAALFLAVRDLFGLMHLRNLDAVIVLPGLGILVLVAWRRRSARRWAPLLAAGLLVLAPVGFYASLVEPYQLRLEHVSLVAWSTRPGKRPSQAQPAP